MTSLGSPGLASQSVSGLSGREEPKNLETERDDNLGKPRLVIPVHFRVFCPKRAKKPNGLGLQPWGAKLVIPVRFGVFWPKRANKNLKQTGMTTLGSPGLSSQSVLGFSGRKGPSNPKTDWDDNPGNPRLVIPVRFGVFWPNRVKKTGNGLG